MSVVLIVLGALAISSGTLITKEAFRAPACRRQSEIKDAYKYSVDKIMCTDLCPCDEGTNK